MSVQRLLAIRNKKDDSQSYIKCLSLVKRERTRRLVISGVTKREGVLTYVLASAILREHLFCLGIAEVLRASTIQILGEREVDRGVLLQGTNMETIGRCQS